MKIKEETHNLLHVESFPVVIGLFCAAGVILDLGRIGYLVWQGAFRSNDAILFVSLAIFFFGGAAFVKKESFVVDRGWKRIFWSRKGLFGTKQGDIPFEDIADVVVEKRRNGHGFRYRVAVETPTGAIPVSCIYSMGAEKKCRQVQEAILRAIT